MGSHPKTTYEKLKKVEGVEVVWYKSSLPKPLRLFSFIIASFKGIIRVDNKKHLPDVFSTLVNLAMVGLYIFDKNLESEFMQVVKNKANYNDVDHFIGKQVFRDGSRGVLFPYAATGLK